MAYLEREIRAHHHHFALPCNVAAVSGTLTVRELIEWLSGRQTFKKPLPHDDGEMTPYLSTTTKTARAWQTFAFGILPTTRRSRQHRRKISPTPMGPFLLCRTNATHNGGRWWLRKITSPRCLLSWILICWYVDDTFQMRWQTFSICW